MGYIRHHAIIVTSWDQALVARAHTEMARLLDEADAIEGVLRRPSRFSALLTPITEGIVNGDQSFALLPNGSKEGWEPSDVMNHMRARFIAWARSQVYADGSSALAWVEVQYGDDEHEARVTKSGDDDARARYTDEAAATR